MTNDTGHINFVETYEYSEKILKRRKAKPIGRLNYDALFKLRDHVGKSETLPEEDIDAILDALTNYLDQ
jgi:hypothetical protein